MFDPAGLRARLERVRERLARAAGRARRDPSSIRLIAVSKTFSADHVRVLAEAGHLDCGENKVQEGLAKIAAAAGFPLRWHLIGHLQSNKAKKAAGAFDWIHSLDSVSLLTRVDQAAVEASRPIELLLQLDLAQEATKTGLAVPDLEAVLRAAAGLQKATVRGLMVLPPASEDPEGSRRYFVALRELRDRMIARGVDAGLLRELSMGMSHDFEVAIEEGATMVRVGSAIFGERHYP